MNNIQNVVKEQTKNDTNIMDLMLEDQETRKAFIINLPEFIRTVTEQLLNEISEEEFKSYYYKSGDNWVQYELSIKLKAGEIEDNKEIRHTFLEDESDSAIIKWMKRLLNHDAIHIAELNLPRRSGGGADQYLKEGLFNTDNLGEINKKFSEVISSVAKTEYHTRLLVGSDWGSCKAFLTITLPKE